MCRNDAQNVRKIRHVTSRTKFKARAHIEHTPFIIKLIRVHLIGNFQFGKIIQTITMWIQFIEDKMAALESLTYIYFKIEEIAMKKYLRLTILE